jgi:pyruvate dehydrogenase E2 component (dihydrolipoamide acetyltransferase)
MAVEVVMPRLGWTMETGSVLAWHKQDGEPVSAGEILFTVQSDKAAAEVEALEDGVLHLPVSTPAIGTDVPIGTVLAYLLAPGEAPPDAAPDTGATPPSVALPPVPAVVSRLEVAAAASRPSPAGQKERGVASAVAPPGDGPRGDDGAARIRPPSSPRARRVAAALGVDWTALRGSGQTGRILERDVRAASLGEAPRVRITPLARRHAAAAGIDVAALAATNAHGEGREGRVMQADVAAGVRRLIAQRLTESARTTVPVTLTTEADATDLVKLRAEVKADADERTGERTAPGEARATGVVPSYTDLLIKVVAIALTEHPDLNASWTEAGIVRHADVHIGLAVDTARGLLVPVVRDVAHKSVAGIVRETAPLIVRARDGRCAPDELRGATFTITNLGMYDIDAFTPVINQPECAVLGVGRIVARPVVVDEAAERVAVRKLLALSLTFDHRIVDGAPAARFLQRVKQLVEHPYRWLTH